MSSVSASDVAAFMLEQLSIESSLYQDVVVCDIRDRFGEGFVYINDNGNLAIDKKVLVAFRKLTEGDVVWDRRERFWRRREDYDASGSRVSD
jgi:hypothetical protein